MDAMVASHHGASLRISNQVRARAQRTCPTRVPCRKSGRSCAARRFLIVNNQYWTSSAVVGSADQELWTVGWNETSRPSVKPLHPELEAVVRCVRVGPRPPSDGGADAPL